MFFSIYTLIFLLFPTLISQAICLSFNFTSFDPSDRDIDYQGDASCVDSAIQLTPNQLLMTGHATYFEPMHLWDNATRNLADFTTSFSFSIDAQNNISHADGFAFFIAPPQYRMPDEKQGSGIGLASGNLTLNSTANPFVAIEFDTYYNPWDDMSDDHVGIDINSLKSTKSVKWYSSVMDGRIMDATISYNSSSKDLCVNFTGVSENLVVEQKLCCEIDLRNYLPEWVICGFSAATGVCSEFHTIHSWSLDSSFQSHQNITTPSPPPPEMPTPISAKEDRNKPVKIAGAVIGSLFGTCMLVLLVRMGAVRYLRHKKTSATRKQIDPSNVNDEGYIEMHPTSTVGDVEQAEPDSIIVESQDNEFRKVTGAKNIPYDVLIRATDGFGAEQKLGQGGFGAVYKGYLRDLDIYVAVKRISEISIQGLAVYTAEVMILSQLRHRNLVQLIGWCHERSQILVVYEYLPNRSLDFHLYSKQSLLKWELRYKIIKGLAEGLQYLHRGWRRCVLHRDIKPSNVMLDSEYNPMFGDFGLAQIVDHDARSQTLQGGSQGYIAPECFDTGKSSKESDIFSFGVVALELACGRKPFVQDENGTQVHIVKWVWEFYGKRKTLKAADQKLNGQFTKKQMECLMIVGLWCAHPDFSFRPSMREVINVLNFDADLPDLPPKFPGTAHTLPLQGTVASSSVNATFRTAPTQDSSYDPINDSSNLKSSTTVPLIRNGV